MKRFALAAFVWLSMVVCTFAQTPPNFGGLMVPNGGPAGGGGVPAAAAPLNLANYLTAAQLTTAQAGVNTQDLTTQIAAWIAACPATGCQYVVPPGYFYTPTCNFNITNAFSMIGAGTRGLLGTQFVSVLVCGSTTARMFNISSKIGNFNNIAFLQNGGTAVAGSSALWICTSGASTDCTTSVGSDNSPSISYDNIMIDGFYDTIDVGVAQSWHGINGTIQNCVHWCYRVRNTVLADAGDWFITGNQIFPAGNANAAVRWESSGGGHINMNEVTVNTGTIMENCFNVETTPGASVEIFIQDNKCESVAGPNIAIFSGWREMVITGNVARVASTTNVSFTGVITAGTATLVVTGSPATPLYRGMVISGVGVPNGTWITNTNGNTGNGSYTLNVTFQSGVVSASMTGSSPGILCKACSEAVITSNILTKLGTTAQAGTAAIMLDNVAGGVTGSTTSATVRANNVNNYNSNLMVSQSYGVNFDGNSGVTLANLPDATQLAPGSTGFVIDATSPVAGQPFTGGGKLSTPVYSDGSRWLASTTVLASNYLGPGDVVPNAKGWWGMMAYNAATAGTKAANVCVVVPGSPITDGTCADINTLANGQLDMVALAALPCTGNVDVTIAGACTVKTFYNKAGANFTTDTTGDMVQTSAPSRYRIAYGPGNNCINQITGLGNQPCLFRPASTFGRYTTVGTISIAQPYTLVGAAARQSNFTTYGLLLGSVTSGQGLYFHLANFADCFIGADRQFASVDVQWQAMMCVAGNGAGLNKGVVNGVTTTLADSLTAFATTETLQIFNDQNNTSDELFGVGAEFGVWGSAFSATQITNMNANIRARYAF